MGPFTIVNDEQIEEIYTETVDSVSRIGGDHFRHQIWTVEMESVYIWPSNIAAADKGGTAVHTLEEFTPLLG